MPIRNENWTIHWRAVENGLCTLCDFNSVEDEKHFILEREIYNSIRSNIMGFILLKIHTSALSPRKKWQIL